MRGTIIVITFNINFISLHSNRYKIRDFTIITDAANKGNWLVKISVEIMCMKIALDSVCAWYVIIQFCET